MKFNNIIIETRVNNLQDLVTKRDIVTRLKYVLITNVNHGVELSVGTEVQLDNNTYIITKLSVNSVNNLIVTIK